MVPPAANPQPINVYEHLPRFEAPQEERIPPPDDQMLADALRRKILVLILSLNDEGSKAQVHQKAAALKSTVDTLRTLETPAQAQEQQPIEQVIRWEFAYNDQLHDAPPWAANHTGPSSPVQGGGLRSPLGQDGTGRDSAA